ncbi:hypothetical protein NBRC10513_002328 [Rhodotorula toruloides]|uniref:Pre-mRNA-splicing factor cwc22 n=2 Tax=Rhodotorula toruloides TaxID=5286 RepID=A0A2T0A894_RHOTO|nr:pre-mRNA-splicing factor cwc22 [Rhodotorula toruloides]
MLLSRTRQALLPLASSSALLSLAPTRNMSSSSSPFPAYLLHAPFLAVQPPTPADGTSAPGQLLQRTLPPAPLYYTHPAPKNPPGTAPPVLSLSPTAPIQGRISTVYRATAPTGEKLVLKYGTDLLALMREAEEVYVNLPAGGLPIPTFWGIFEGKVLEEQNKSLVMVMEDCGEPVEDGFEALTWAERQKLFDALDTFHSIHFQHGSFSPSSIVARPAPTPSEPVSPISATTEAPARKLTIVGFSQAEWHLCPGVDSCKELVEARKALKLDEPEEA